MASISPVLVPIAAKAEEAASSDAQAAGSSNEGAWREVGSAVLQRAQRAAAAAVVGGVAHSTLARVPLVGARGVTYLKQCCGSGSGGFLCFWASRIRIH
jgi:hypothetical protein